ncbi:MAG: methionyl-tRNA formyltransferase [Thermodesulfatator sp.]|nr:MAG: methionyl-tRNA formyltransferase [Thermodesulfatator sp.]
MSTSKRFKIVFMGTPEFAVAPLKNLINGPDELIAVVSQPDRPKGRGRKLLPTPVKATAQAAGIEVLQPSKVRNPEFLETLRALEPDLIVVAAFGQILPQALLDIPKIMPINIHGSLLPRYRGAAPIHWALINGDKETGITIMKMDAGMDTGPMLLKGSLTIGQDETFGQLAERMSELGASLLMEALEKLEKGELKEEIQPEDGVTYAPPIKKEQYHVDWNQPAELIHGTIRAFDPRPGAYTLYKDQRLRLYCPVIMENEKTDQPPGTVVDVSPKAIRIQTGSTVLGIRQIQWPGKKRLDVDSFLRGRNIPAGTRFK